MISFLEYLQLDEAKAEAPPIQTVLRTILDEFKSASKTSMYRRDEDAPEDNNGQWTCGLRDWGKWASEPGSDDEDDDWEVLDKAWGEKARVIISNYQKQYPQYNLNFQTGEKNWIYISGKEKK